MNGFDVALLVVGCILVLIGMWKGLVRILIGIAALIAAFALAARFHEPLAARLTWVRLPDEPLMLLAYISIFLGVMLLGGALAYLLRRLLRAAMLGWADRMAGAALGLVATALLSSLLVLPFVAYSERGQEVLRRSVLAPWVTAVANLASPLMPSDLADLYRSRLEELRRLWYSDWLETQGPEV